MRSFLASLSFVGIALFWSGSSLASDPTIDIFWWESDMGPTTMWSASQGYCFLVTVDIGNSIYDEVSIDLVDGNWVLAGAASSEWISTYAIAECLAWPEGWTTKSAPWVGGESQANVSQNNCFCTIGGMAYSGSTDGSTPQMEVHGYPTTNSSVTLTEFVTNNETYSSRVRSNCICPNGGPNLWGNYSPSPGNVTLATLYSGQSADIPFSSLHVCGFINMQASMNGGGIELEMFGGTSADNYHWYMDTQGSSGGFFTAACIPWQ